MLILYNCQPTEDQNKMKQIVKVASKIIGVKLFHLKTF